MQKASEQLAFEDAIRYRDLYNSVKSVAQKQKITDSDGEDKDIIALAKDESDAVVQVFFVRDGKLAPCILPFRYIPDRARDTV